MLFRIDSSYCHLRLGGATEMFGFSDGDVDRATLELATAVRDRIERWGRHFPADDGSHDWMCKWHRRRKPVPSTADADERQRSGSHRKGIAVSQSGRKRATLELGHDAFLDIVANLVGILIILVVVLGTQSTAVIEEIKEQVEEEKVAETDDFMATDEQLAALAQQSMRAAAAQADSNRFEKIVRQYDAEIERSEAASGRSSWTCSPRPRRLGRKRRRSWTSEATQMAPRQTEFKTAQEELAKLRGGTQTAGGPARVGGRRRTLADADGQNRVR